MAITVAPPPEARQLVSVRSRQWVVADMAPRTLLADSLRAGLEAPQHLLTHSSIGDDGLGEELQVIWELEPGARLVDSVALTADLGIDSPGHLLWASWSTASLASAL